MSIKDRIKEYMNDYEDKILNTAGKVWYFTLTTGEDVVAKIVLPLDRGFVIEYPAKIVQVQIESPTAPDGIEIKTLFAPLANKYTNQKEFLLTNDKILFHGEACKFLNKFYSTNYHPTIVKELALVEEKNEPEEKTAETEQMDKAINDLKKAGKLISFTPNKSN